MRHASTKRALGGLLGLSLLIGPACSSGGGNSVIPPGTNEVELHYDADNVSSPNLDAGTYEAAARFTTAQTAMLAGGELTKVNFYVHTAPTSCTVKVYGAGTATAPGAQVYAADVTADVLPGTWNSHVLTSPLSIPGGDLWIAIEFTNAATQPTIGCDPGPAVQDGDWLHHPTDGWIPLGTKIPSVDINWNIRGIVAVPA